MARSIDRIYLSLSLSPLSLSISLLRRNDGVLYSISTILHSTSSLSFPFLSTTKFFLSSVSFFSFFLSLDLSTLGLKSHPFCRKSMNPRVVLIFPKYFQEDSFDSFFLHPSLSPSLSLRLFFNGYQTYIC